LITQHPIENRAQWLELRRHDIGASEIGALFNAHPYITAAALYADKAGLMPDDDAGSTAARGIKLEPLVADQIQAAHPDWKIEKATHYFRDPVHRIGATPDYFVTRPDGWHGPLDIKTVEESKFNKVWKQDDGRLVPEPFILLQVVQQMHLTGGDGGMVGVMPISGWGSFPAYEIEVPQRPDVVAQILARADDFWNRMLRRDPPEFDYERDADAIKALYPQAVPGREIDLRGDNRMRQLLDERERLKEEVRALEAIEAEIKAKIGDAEIAIINGWHLTYKSSNRKGYTVEPTTVRTLRAKRLHANRIFGE
jgi:predicted phage-related endonuclease